MIFDPMNKIFYYARRRVSDLKENAKVTMPKPGDAKEEAELEMIRKIVMEEFRTFRKALDESELNKGDRGSRNQASIRCST